MSFRLGCSLCAVLLEPNTQCQHGKFIQTEGHKTEMVKTIIKKSVLGDKIKEEPVTRKITVQKLVCRCGKTILGEASIVHLCTHKNIENTMRGYSGITVQALTHPSGLPYRYDCKACDDEGQIRVRQFKRCHACEGTGGIKCYYCAGLGADIRTSSEVAFWTCPKNCSFGYKERCALCSGECALRGGVIATDCNRCVQPDEPVIAPIAQVGDRILQVRQPVSLPQIPKYEIRSPRPPSPSQISTSQVELESSVPTQ